MLSFRYYITEIFDSSYKFSKTLEPRKGESEPHIHEYEFHTKASKPKVEICQWNKQKKIDVMFSDDGNIESNNKSPYEAHKVLSTVETIIKHHLSKNPHITHVEFSGYNEKDSNNGTGNATKANLYRKMLNRDPTTKGKYKETDDGPKATLFSVKIKD